MGFLLDPAFVGIQARTVAEQIELSIVTKRRTWLLGICLYYGRFRSMSKGEVP
jgi:hypothetical protein